MPAVHGPQSDFYDPRDGGRPVRMQSLHLQRGSREPPRTNYFGIYRIDSGCGTVAADDAHCHPVLAQLGALIEENYRTWHSPALYADALHMAEKTLGRVVREHLGTTPTDLIRRRILTHAKWQLLHTLRPVKEIAQEVGFS